MKLFKSWFPLALLLTGLLIGSCGKDDEMNPQTGTDPISSFQFEIDATDFLKVVFSNFSNNADSYSWDFGDSNSSTDESPTHSYAAAGTYDVVLTAINSTGSKTSTKSVTIVDPGTAGNDLTGAEAKVWKLSRNTDAEDLEFPVLVGPENRSEIWWALGINDPIGARPCLMEEEYTFKTDGSFVYDTKGSVFAEYEIWEGTLAGQCVDDTNASNMMGPNGEDLSAWGSGTHAFDYDASAGTLTLTGLGAHVGLAKVSTASEVNVPQPAVTYKVVSLETSGAIDKMVLETTIDGGYWQFNLVSYDNPADEPDLPGAAPTAAFLHEIDGSSVTFTNTSVNADSYTWDFGDGMTSTMESPNHTYASDGSYNVVMTATNSVGSSDATATVIIAVNSVFSATTLSGAGNKTWKLNPEAGALSVGSTEGSGNFFATSAADVTSRACTFDDNYIFNDAGVFEYQTNGDLWAEQYMGVDPPGCIMDADIPSTYVAWGSGMHSYTVTDATAMSPALVTITGTGAFIGLPKAYNGGEYAGEAPVANGSVTYRVLSYVNDGSKEILVLSLDISAGEVGTAWWAFTLVSE